MIVSFTVFFCCMNILYIIRAIRRLDLFDFGSQIAEILKYFHGHRQNAVIAPEIPRGIHEPHQTAGFLTFPHPKPSKAARPRAQARDQGPHQWCGSKVYSHWILCGNALILTQSAFSAHTFPGLRRYFCILSFTYA